MLAYRIDVETKMVHILGETPSDVAEFQQLMHNVLADPDFRPGFGFLRDRTGMKPLGTDSARDAGHVLKQIKSLPTSKFAVVVDDGASLRSVRSVQLLTEGTWVEFAVFGLLESAIDWLQQPSLTLTEARRLANTAL